METNQKYINAMRLLALHAIQKAKLGHVGMSMSACPLTYTLYMKQINISKQDPKWFNRDRFVLSAGHGSLTLYTLFHFAGLLSLEDMKSFKTLHSKTPGHPEITKDNFIDASTGPLGQGAAMAVGMAVAEKYLNNRFASMPGLMDHYTYAVLGDGDLQEGVCYEAMSLAGKLQLNKLIFVHDSNDFQLDSDVQKVFNEDLQMRMQSMHWHYIKTSNDVNEINAAINEAKKQNKPCFIEVKTIIGEGMKTQSSNKAHSMAITDEDVQLANKYYNMDNKPFEFAPEIYEHFAHGVLDHGQLKYEEWKKLCEKYAKDQPTVFAEFKHWMKNDFGNINDMIKSTTFASKSVPTRNYVKDFLTNFTSKKMDWLIAGCADLAAATNIKMGESDFASDLNSNNILFGIREFAMSAITNGILLHGGLKTVSGTFLVFSDYMKSAIRLGALMQLPNLYIFTHDSYQVGGDGPTHQPVDQLPMLRAIPNVIVHKPCDETEFMNAMYQAFNSTTNTHIIILTRHNLSSEHNTDCVISNKGGYVLDGNDNADITLVGCGSEIDLLFATQKKLLENEITAKIVSVPSLNTLLLQDSKYIKQMLCSKRGVLTVEASSDYMWYKLASYSSKHVHIGAYSFGESMDGAKLYELKGFHADNLAHVIEKQLK